MKLTSLFRVLSSVVISLSFVETVLASSSSDSLGVEVQVKICDSIENLQNSGFLNHNDNNFQTYYVENNKLDLLKKDIIIRVRSYQDEDKVKVTLKQYFENEEVTSSKDILKNNDCEYDMHGTQMTKACKIESKLTHAEFLKALNDQNLQDLLSDEQKQYLKSHKVDLKDDGYQIKGYSADSSWSYNTYTIDTGLFNHKEYIEISERTSLANSRNKQTEILSFLNRNSIKICDDQVSRFTEEKLQVMFKN